MGADLFFDFIRVNPLFSAAHFLSFSYNAQKHLPPLALLIRNVGSDSGLVLSSASNRQTAAELSSIVRRFVIWRN
jgi:hypothetical protein